MKARYSFICTLLLLITLFTPFTIVAQNNSQPPGVALTPFDQTRYDEWLPTIDTTYDANKISVLVSVKNY